MIKKLTLLILLATCVFAYSANAAMANTANASTVMAAANLNENPVQTAEANLTVNNEGVTAAAPNIELVANVATATKKKETTLNNNETGMGAAYNVIKPIQNTAGAKARTRVLHIRT